MVFSLKGKHRTWLGLNAIWILLVLALLLRVAFVPERYLGNDEPYTLDWISNGLTHFLQVSSTDPSPPFFYFLALLFNSIFGLFGVYAFVILCGVASIFVLYKIAEMIFNRKVALLSAFLLSIGTMHVLYSQHLRPYSFIQLIVLLGFYFSLIYLKNLEKKSLDKKPLFCLSILFIISVITYYPSIICFVIFFGYIFLHRFKHKAVPIKEFIFFIPAPIVFVLLFIFFREKFSAATGTYAYPLFENFFYFFYKHFAAINISTAVSSLPYALLFGFLLMLLFLIGAYLSRKKPFVNFVLYVIFGSIVFYYFAYPVINQILYFKHMSSMAPLLFLFPAYALEKLREKNRWSFLGFLLVIILLSALLLAFYYYTITSAENWIPIIGH